MLKRGLYFIGLAAAIGIGIYAYFHFANDEGENGDFYLSYLPGNADLVLEFNSLDQLDIEYNAIQKLLPNPCAFSEDYKKALAALNREDFKSAWMAVYNCSNSCLLIKTKQNLSSSSLGEWQGNRKSTDLYLFSKKEVESAPGNGYKRLQTFLKPSSKARLIVKQEEINAEAVYSIHDISKQNDQYHFTGFVVNDENKLGNKSKFELNEVSRILPKSTVHFRWKSVDTDFVNFKEDNISEMLIFNTKEGSEHREFTALKMKISSEQAQKTFKVSNSKIGLVGNTNWMESEIPEMNNANHYSLINGWVLCANKSEDLSAYAKLIAESNWSNSNSYSSISEKMGMNLASVEYNFSDEGSIEIVQNVFTKEGQHYNIVDVLDSDNLVLAEKKNEEVEREENPPSENESEINFAEAFTFVNHYTREKELVVQDKENNLLLMSKDHQIIFKRKLDGPVIGQFKMVDALKNNKYQLLFNTGNKIYLIDRKGRDVEHFPIKLDSPASNELAVLDYDGDKNYRLFIGLDNGEIRNYTIKAKRVNGWKYQKREKAIIYPVTHLRLGSKDYLFTLNEDYEIQLLDRKGKIRHPLEQQPEDLENLAFEIFKESKIQNSGIRYMVNGKEKEFVFGKSSS